MYMLTLVAGIVLSFGISFITSCDRVISGFLLLFSGCLFSMRVYLYERVVEVAKGFVSIGGKDYTLEKKKQLENREPWLTICLVGGIVCLIVAIILSIYAE